MICRLSLVNMAEGGGAETQSSEESLGMKAVLIGATGAIGECLLGELLCSKVCCLVAISLLYLRCRIPKNSRILEQILDSRNSGLFLF